MQCQRNGKIMRKNEKKHGFSLVVSKKCVPLHSLHHKTGDKH